jgi:hypothetical protein
MKKVLFWLTVFFASVVSETVTADEWGEPKKDQESIKVYTREIPATEFDEFKGVTEIKTSLNSLVALLEDTEACSSWMYRCISERTLRIVNSNEKYNYSVSEGSLLEDRDVVVHIIRTQDQESKTVTYQRTDDQGMLPEQPNLTRVRLVKGSWILKPVQGGNVSVTFQMLSDPGGRVPAFLANLASVDTPYNTLLKLR